MNEYLQAVNLYIQNNVDLRYGQALFNVLLERNPDLAEQVRGTELDPFYWEANASQTLDFQSWLAEKFLK